MKIGIDTDGVLTDMTTFLSSKGQQRLNREPVEPHAYRMDRMFRATRREKLRYGMGIFIDYCKNCPPRDGAQRVVDQLNRDGHELYEITARKFATRKNPLGRYSKKMLLSWYEKHGFEFDKIFFCKERKACMDKARVCRDNGVQIMIEDRPDIAVNLADSGIPVLLFDAPYNHDTHGDLITRVHSWDEVYEQVLAMCAAT